MLGYGISLATGLVRGTMLYVVWCTSESWTSALATCSVRETHYKRLTQQSSAQMKMMDTRMPGTVPIHPYTHTLIHPYSLSLPPLTLSLSGRHGGRGATIEKCLEFLTESVSHLWGGFSLRSGPRSHGNELGKRATRQQITTFFLTCYQSFVHPLVLSRLLLHRLATPCSQNPFDWSMNLDKRGSTPSYAHLDSLPSHQAATLKVIGRWLEDHPDDFLDHPQLLVSGVDTPSLPLSLSLPPSLPPSLILFLSLSLSHSLPLLPPPPPLLPPLLRMMYLVSFTD